MTYINYSFKNIKIAHLYFLAIIFGVITGYYNISFLLSLGEVITGLFIKIFKFISLPIISLSIIVTLSKLKEDKNVKEIWKRTLYYTLSTTIIAASLACILYYLINPTNISIAPSFMESTKESLGQKSYLNYLGNIVPSDIFTPFIEHQVISVLIISILIGTSICFIPDNEHRNAISNFFKGAYGIFFVITSWVVKIIPIALFGFISTSIAQLKNGIHVSGLTGYLSVIILANLIQGLVILPILLRLHKIAPFKTMKAMMPALSVAFFSKSSVGVLPITINTIENNLKVSPKISRMVLPLCTSINMNGCATFIFTTVIYLMQNHGIEINLITMIVWIIIATIAAIGNAGVPMGCFFLSASLLSSMNIPIELLGLILPIYSIIDMMETSLNVWSDSCITKIIDQKFAAV